MASRPALLITTAMAAAVAVVVGALLPATASATVYKVGDDSGWTTGVDYGAWASGKKFHCGDQIEFVYPKGSHNVVLVDEASYEACTVPSGAYTMTSGDSYVTFGANDGQRFFICGFEGHCQAGMKLTVNVLP